MSFDDGDYTDFTNNRTQITTLVNCHVQLRFRLRGGLGIKGVSQLYKSQG